MAALLHQPSGRNRFWRAYYGDVVRSGTALDRIHPIVYGDGFPGFVRRMAKRHGRDSNPRPFTARGRDYHPFWRSDEARAAIEDIKSLWRARGLELGDLADVRQGSLNLEINSAIIRAHIPA